MSARKPDMKHIYPLLSLFIAILALATIPPVPDSHHGSTAGGTSLHMITRFVAQ